MTASGQTIFHAVTELGWSDPRTGVVVVLLGLVLATIWRVRRMASLGATGMLWFLLLLVPSSALVVLDRGEPSVCMTHPGFDPDLVITTDSLSFMRVFIGVDDLATALDAGKVRIDGPPRLVRDFPRWFLWSPFMPTVRARVKGAPEVETTA